MKVYVVTGFELGWDCVVGIFSNKCSLEKLKEIFPEDEFYINEKTINSNLKDYE